MGLTFPPIEFLADELIARGWSFDDLIDRMPGDREINACAVSLMTLKDKSILLGQTMADRLSVALGTSAELWLNLDESWRKE